MSEPRDGKAGDGRPKSVIAARARRRGVAAQRRVLVATAIAVAAAAGVMWVARPVDPPAAGGDADAGAPVRMVGFDGEEQLPIGPSDADVLLVNGEPSVRVRRDTLPARGPVSFDLAIPVRIDDADVLETRVMTEGRDRLVLDGRVGGPDRNMIHVELPVEWLVPGSYLFEIETTERSHFPIRRFALMID